MILAGEKAHNFIPGKQGQVDTVHLTKLVVSFIAFVAYPFPTVSDGEVFSNTGSNDGLDW